MLDLDFDINSFFKQVYFLACLKQYTDKIYWLT